MKNLEQSILVTNHGHLDTGMHGTYFLLKLLMEEDRNDLIYEFASKTDFPGWGYMLEHGATTMWESWTGMSHIHDTLISIGSWFIQGLGGIRVDAGAPGFRRFAIKPAPVGGLTYARAGYRSVRGEIASEWRVENGTFHLDVAVPPGTTARVYLPTSDPAGVTEGGRPAAGVAGIKAAGAENGKAVFEVGSGRYAFAAKL
jgi:alpha-L-rhamnosidase